MPSERESSGASGQAAALFAFADAVRAAGEQARPPDPAKIHQFVTFFLRDQEFGLPILQCREIVRVPTITRMPEAPAHVRGVVNLRGHIVPAVDTRRCFALEAVQPTPRSRLIVVEVAGRGFALIVDRVARILKLPASQIESPRPDRAAQGVAGVLRAGDALVYLLDAERVLRLAPAADVPRAPNGLEGQ
jgi:purine-binding chemotaxis protein CheW